MADGRIASRSTVGSHEFRLLCPIWTSAEKCSYVDSHI